MEHSVKGCSINFFVSVRTLTVLAIKVISVKLAIKVISVKLAIKVISVKLVI
ncbi:hypothetical protein [Ezakiella coagulans]|uniref:hypothetical protein n=1 Tax=Ezakiella coagulans TaxID=46507 RepID=UPI0014024A45|nr:hypothetical protein [Ezakiella coagulans]